MTKNGGKGGSPGDYLPGYDKKWPPKPKPKPKLAKKNKKSGGVYGKSDKKYEGPEPDYKTNDHLYGEVAKGKAKFKRDPRTEANA